MHAMQLDNSAARDLELRMAGKKRTTTWSHIQWKSQSHSPSRTQTTKVQLTAMTRQQKRKTTEQRSQWRKTKKKRVNVVLVLLPQQAAAMKTRNAVTGTHLSSTSRITVLLSPSPYVLVHMFLNFFGKN